MPSYFDKWYSCPVAGVQQVYTLPHQFPAAISPMITTMIVAVFLFFTVRTVADDTITIPDDAYYMDSVKKIICINRCMDMVPASMQRRISTIRAGAIYRLAIPVTELATGYSYIVTTSFGETFTLFITRLPIVHITTNNAIVDSPMVRARLHLACSNSTVVDEIIGIEHRGSSTQVFPKKSYRFEIWSDTIGLYKKNMGLLGMRVDDDWILNAMYNEPLRIRSMTNFKLWRMIDTLHYCNHEPDAINGIRQVYAELFINSEYQGVYSFGERIDRKQLCLAKNDGTLLTGELYKGIGWGASTFSTLLPYDNHKQQWNGFEYVYPDDITDWSSLYEFVDFVLHDDSIGFYQEYGNKFDVDNAVDYFIFLNLLRATDNTGKNVYIAKYTTDGPFFYVPWDLDGTFGIIWNGTREPITEGLLVNGFYDRLLLDMRVNGFRDKLRDRWCSLRKKIITKSAIMDMLTNEFRYLTDNGVYARERIAWPECTFLDSTNLHYTATWLEARLSYLDKVFDSSITLVPCNETANHTVLYARQSVSFSYINHSDHVLKPYYAHHALAFATNLLGQVMSNPAGNDISGCKSTECSDGIYIIVQNNFHGTLVTGKRVIMGR